MKKLIFILSLLSFFSYANAQFFRIKANKDFKMLLNSTAIEEHKSFIDNYPKSNHIPEVQKRLFSLEMQADYNTVNDYDELYYYLSFLDEYQEKDTTYYVADLILQTPKQMLEEINYRVAEGQTWNELLESYYDYDTTISKYQEFIVNFPDSKHCSEANEIIEYRKEKNYWNSIKDLYRISLYENYIEKYNDGNYTYRAKELILLCQEWNETKILNTHEAYANFAEDNYYTVFYDSARIAMKQIETPLWEKAKKRNSYNAYNNFQKKYPNGYYFDDAERQIYDLANTDLFYVYFSLRDKKQTKIEINNTLNVPLSIVFSGAGSYKIQIRANSKKTITVRNGYYNLTSSAPGYETDYDHNLLFAGFDIEYTVYSVFSGYSYFY